MKKCRSQGFTVLELLSAVAIIAALVAIAIPAYQAYQNKSRTAEATIFLSAAQVAEKSFFQAEKSYTACLPAIMDMPSSQVRFYAVGFNLDPSGTYAGCGPAPTSNQNCLQKCFSNTTSCASATMGCTLDSSANGVAYTSNALGTNVDFYGTAPGAIAPGSAYYSSGVSATDFEVVAVTDESQLSKNDFLEKLYPTAYAASLKAFGIGPSGPPYIKSASQGPPGNCRIVPVGSIGEPVLVQDASSDCNTPTICQAYCSQYFPGSSKGCTCQWSGM